MMPRLERPRPPARQSAARQSHGASVVASITLLTLAICVTGCARPLLSPTDERSPFDRYDATRDQFAQQYVTDRYGAKEMNLRARLSPKR